MRRDDLEKLAGALGGLAILGCLPNSPAAEAGLRYGDVLLSVNGRATPDWTEYIHATRERKRPMIVHVFRDGAEHTFTLELPETPVGPPLPTALLSRIMESGALPKLVSASFEEDEDVPAAKQLRS